MGHESHDAEVALHTMGSRLASERPDRFGGLVEKSETALDAAQNASDSDLVSYLDEIVEFGVDNLTGSIGALLTVLDQVSTLHPFVGAAVIAFRGILNLELIRRENDKRVLAVYAKMCNTMATLRFLRRLPPDHKVDGRSVKDHLFARVTKILADIQECAEVCDLFQAKPFWERVLKSPQWKSNLTSFMAKFDAHDVALRDALSLLNTFSISQTSIRVEHTHETTLKIDTKLDAVMDALVPLKELQLQRAIEERLGSVERALDSEGSRVKLTQLIDECSTDEDKLISNAADIWDDRGEKSFSDQEKSFQRKLALSEKLSATGRVRSPNARHDTKIDDDLLAFCKTQLGAGDHISARVIVSRLLEYCTKKYIHDAAYPDDTWAKIHLTVSDPRTLVEAIDVDASDSISSNELAVFFRKRPQHWSLPCWLAYWTIGTSLALKSDYQHIRDLLQEIRDLSTQVLSTNRAYVQKLLGEGVFYACDCLLSGIYMAVGGINWDTGLFDKFRDFEDLEADKLRQGLAALEYELDTPDTLDLVVGGSNQHIDKAVFPLLRLMLERCKDVIKTSACQHPLRRRDIFPLRQSLWTLLRACHRRIGILKDALIDNSDDSFRQYLASFSFGTYQYIYRYSDLGGSEYVRKEHNEEITTPGLLDGTHSDEQLVSLTKHPLWDLATIKEVLLDPRHDLHAFVQLCVDQGVSAPEGYPTDSFETMVREALAKASADNATGEIFEPGPDRKYRQNTLRPRRRLTTLLVPSKWDQLRTHYSEELRLFYCRIVDNIVRRQVIHTPVMCDHCKKRTLNVTRLICLDCHSDDCHSTTDYCASCLHEELNFDCRASHRGIRQAHARSFLQLRRFSYNKWTYAMLYQARAVSHGHFGTRSDARKITCHRCDQDVRGTLVWLCLDCMRNNSHVYVCPDCNFKQEKEINLLVFETLVSTSNIHAATQPSDGIQNVNDLTMIKPSSMSLGMSDTHHWSHTLVSVTVTHHGRPPPVRSSRVIPGSPTYPQIFGGSTPRVYDSPLPVVGASLPSSPIGVPTRRSSTFSRGSDASALGTIDEQAEDAAPDLQNKWYFPDRENLTRSPAAASTISEPNDDEDWMSTSGTAIDITIEPPSRPASPESASSPTLGAYRMLSPEATSSALPLESPTRLRDEPPWLGPSLITPRTGTTGWGTPPGFVPSDRVRQSQPYSAASAPSWVPYPQPRHPTPPIGQSWSTHGLQSRSSQREFEDDAPRNRPPSVPHEYRSHYQPQQHPAPHSLPQAHPRTPDPPSNSDLMYEILSLRERTLVAEERSLTRSDQLEADYSRRIDDLRRQVSALQRDALARELHDVRHRMSSYWRDDRRDWDRNAQYDRGRFESRRDLPDLEDVHARLRSLEEIMGYHPNYPRRTT